MMRAISLAVGLILVGPLAAQACPTLGNPMAMQIVTEADFGDQGARFPVVAGGDVYLGNCGYPGGYTITQPDFSFDMRGVYGPIQVSVDSPGCDTLLLINGPDGSWYYDDDSSGDLMPWLEVIASDGLLDVWVGTYGGEYCDATLILY